MTFEHPWMLLGMLGAAIPVVIHLSHRRWAREIPFAAIDFLLLSDKRLARRFRLRQLLVLLLRVLLIAAVPFALAKPSTASDERLVVPTASPTSVVLIVDNSASMSFSHDGETLLQRAVERARALVSEVPPSHNLAVVTAASPARVVVGPLTFDRAAVSAALSDIHQTEAGTDIHGALRAAEDLLAASRLSHRQVLLLSDMTSAGWPEGEQTAPPWVTTHPPAVRIVDVAEGIPLLDTGIVDARVQPGASEGGEAVELHVTVRNQRDEPWQDLVTVSIDGRPLTGYLKVPARGEATKVFQIDVDRVKDRYGTVEIARDDLALDDVHAFTLGVAEPLRVLILDGAPRSVPYLDEVFFLERALRPERGQRGGGLAPVTMAVDELSAAQLEHTDVVILANVGALPPDGLEALEHFVRRGGGLLVAGGDNMTPDAARALDGLLPLPVRELRRAGAAFGGDGVTHFAPPNVEDPVFTPFLRSADSSLYRARVSRYLLLDSASKAGATTLLSYTDGAPALVDRRVGEGRVLLLTTTLDRDWTDLPIHTAYLPLVHSVVRALVRGRERGGPDSALVGESLTLPIPRRTVRVEVTPPEGPAAVFTRAPSDSPAPLTLDSLDRAGLYLVDMTVAGTEAPSEHRVIAVGLDPRELDLERVRTAEVLASLNVPGAGLAPGSAQGAGTRGSESDGRTHHWSIVLLALFALLFSETWLVVRG